MELIKDQVFQDRKEIPGLQNRFASLLLIGSFQTKNKKGLTRYG